MAILAGIDEAGYGPTLGPLIVSGVAFRVPDSLQDACLWKVLRESCAKKLRRRDGRLPVADSKELYVSRTPQLGLATLERTALVMFAAAGQRPACWNELVGLVAPNVLTEFGGFPWYGHCDPPLPLAPEVGDIGTRANGLRRDFHRNGVDFLGAFCEPVPESRFNSDVSNGRNKADVTLAAFLRIIQRIVEHCRPEEAVFVFADRLGGRAYYQSALQSLGPGIEVSVLNENSARSSYRVVTGAWHGEISFATRGDSSSFTTALASVFCKYLREGFMRLFNEYWCQRIEGLTPTSGYFSDARRWLTQAAEGLRKLGVDPALLIRQR